MNEIVNFNMMDEEQYAMFNLKAKLDSIAKYDTNNNPYWSARDLQEILGYVEWRKFNLVIQRAINSCIQAGFNPKDHFVQVDKTIITGNNASRTIDDYYLTRYACTLICQNGNPTKKKEIAYAQTYFSLLDYSYSQAKDMIEYQSRANNRERATEVDKSFSGVIINHNAPTQKVAMIKSKGDEAFFGGFNTQQMKQKLGIAKNVSLNDCLHSLPLSFKTAAMELSKQQILDNNICGQKNITTLHVNNNEATRNFMINNGYYPENFPAQENFRKLERRTNKIEEIEPDTLVIATDVDTGETVIVRSPFQKIDLNEYYKNNKD